MYSPRLLLRGSVSGSTGWSLTWNALPGWAGAAEEPLTAQQLGLFAVNDPSAAPEECQHATLTSRARGGCWVFPGLLVGESSLQEQMLSTVVATVIAKVLTWPSRVQSPNISLKMQASAGARGGADARVLCRC